MKELEHLLIKDKCECLKNKINLIRVELNALFKTHHIVTTYFINKNSTAKPLIIKPNTCKYAYNVLYLY